MKKVFLSVPMRGRHKDDIMLSLEKMKQITKIAFGDDVEFINTIVKDVPPEGCHESVWYLGESIKLLSQADVLVSVDCPYWLRAKGCENETRIFQDYLVDYNKRQLQHIELPIALVMDQDEFETLRRENEKSCACDDAPQKSR